MRFVDRPTVRKMFEGKFVCLVGSGPGILDNPSGFIDSHDVVCRVNNYGLSGATTGRRTDAHYSFYGTSIRKKVDELVRDGVQLCINKCPDAKFIESQWHEVNGKTRGVDFREIHRERAGWWFCDTYVPTVDEFMAHFTLLGGHVPTTGFAALLDILSFKPANIYMTGFDWFTSKVHNVNQRWKPANPGDPIGHVPDAEREWFAENVEHLPVTMDSRLADTICKHHAGEIRKNAVRFRPRQQAA